MKIMKANVKDVHSILYLLQQVARVHHEARPDLFQPNVTKYDEEQLLELLNDSNYHIGVAKEDEQVLGYIFCIFQTNNSHLLTNIKTLYIDDLCVDKEARGKAIGKQLYEYALVLAKSEECYNLTLNVWADNVAALKFYETLDLKTQKIGMEKIIE